MDDGNGSQKKADVARTDPAQTQNTNHFKLSQLLLGSPLAGTELTLQREAVRERFIEIQE